MYPADFLLIPAVVLLYLCWRLRRRLRSLFVGPPLVLVTLLALLAAGYSLWYHHRPSPSPERRELAPGVIYIREVRTLPRSLIIHIVEIDLEEPGLEFLVTPPDWHQGKAMKARTTSQFVREFPVQVAINASFFYPWHANGPFDYYPRAGDPCEVCGECSSHGREYSWPHAGFTKLEISKDNRVIIGRSGQVPWNAISGREILLMDGQVVSGLRAHPSMPQTAIAIDRTGRKMIWVVVDGRQPNYSEGVPLNELAGICKEFGGWSAMALDGGGSSTLVARGADGDPIVLNNPIHGRHPPGRERPVGNHLGIMIRKN